MCPILAGIGLTWSRTSILTLTLILTWILSLTISNSWSMFNVSFLLSNIFSAILLSLNQRLIECLCLFQFNSHDNVIELVWSVWMNFKWEEDPNCIQSKSRATAYHWSAPVWTALVLGRGEVTVAVQHIRDGHASIHWLPTGNHSV